MRIGSPFNHVRIGPKKILASSANFPRNYSDKPERISRGLRPPLDKNSEVWILTVLGNNFGPIPRIRSESEVRCRRSDVGGRRSEVRGREFVAGTRHACLRTDKTMKTHKDASAFFIKAYAILVRLLSRFVRARGRTKCGAKAVAICRKARA